MKTDIHSIYVRSKDKSKLQMYTFIILDIWNNLYTFVQIVIQVLEQLPRHHLQRRQNQSVRIIC